MRFSPARPEPGRAPLPVVVIAASAGGIPALAAVLAPLPPELPAPVVVVSHRIPGRPSHLAAVLARWTLLPVREPSDGDALRAGCVYVCAPDRYTRLLPDGTVAVTDAPDAPRPRPRADPVFRSVAEYAGARAIAVILTGYGHDGAAGAAEVQLRSGLVLVQTPATCLASGMPDAVLGAAGADFVLPPEAMAHALVSVLLSPRISAALFGLATPRWRYHLGRMGPALA